MERVTVGILRESLVTVRNDLSREDADRATETREAHNDF